MIGLLSKGSIDIIMIFSLVFSYIILNYLVCVIPIGFKILSKELIIIPATGD